MARLTFNENELTIGDLEDFEEVTGVSITDALKSEKVRDDDGNLVRDEETGRPVEAVKMSAKTLKALVWITSRKDDPAFTLEDARNVRITELDIVRAGEESEDTTEATADPKE